MGSRPPLAGFNHNIRYGDRVYHVQTEDSGLDNPHIFTHLFLSGMIISSAKTDYAHLLGEADCDEKIRKLMQDQHKRLMKELRHGAYDQQIIAMVGSVQAEAEPAALEPVISAPAQAGVEEPAAAAAAAADTPGIESPAPAAALAALESTQPEPARPAPAAVPPPVPADEPPPEPGAHDTGEEPVVPLFAPDEQPEDLAARTTEIPLEPEPRPARPPAPPEPALPRSPAKPEPAPRAPVQPRVRETPLPLPALPRSRLATPGPLPIPGRGAPAAREEARRRRATGEDSTLPYVSEAARPPSAPRPAAPSARDGAAAGAQREPPGLEVSITERPYVPAGRTDEIDVTERIDMREAMRRSGVRGGARPPSAPAAPARRPPSATVPPLPPQAQTRPPSQPTAPARRPPSDTVPPLPLDRRSVTPMPALPRIPRAGVPAAPRAAAPASVDRPSGTFSLVDRPPPDEAAREEPAPLVTPTFYSQMRRRRGSSEELPESTHVRGSGARPHQTSRVFDKPVPGAPTLPPVEERTPVGPMHSRRSGVYPIPGLPGLPPERPPHPDPNVRATARPAYGSTPQRYTAPSRMSAAVPRRTGTGERPGWNRPSLPAAARAGTEPRSDARTGGTAPKLPAVDVHPGKPRQPSGPSMKPLPRASGRPPSTELPRAPQPPAAAAPPVVARPAVMVGESTARPPSAQIDPRRPAVRPRSPQPTPDPGAARAAPPVARPAPAPEAPPAPPAPPPRAPAAPPRPGPGSGATTPAGASVFGAGLITERSLDEVILSYLAEDVESDE